MINIYLKKKDTKFLKTWDEMFALGDKAKNDGLSLFTYSTSGYFDCTVPALLAASGGLDLVNDAYNYKEGTWTSKRS